MKRLELLAFLLLLVGGINLGLIGAFNYNLVTTVLGDGNITRILYSLVGLGALYEAFKMMRRKSA
jgi:uncharacterized membrane protein YuzA (DUF378 family)